MKPRVLITGRIPKEWLGELAHVADVRIWQGGADFLMPRKELLAGIGEYHALINFTDVKADEELVQKAVKLKIIANCSIGFDNLHLPLLTTHNIWASNAPGFFNYPVSEYAFAGMLVISRRLLEADDFVRRGGWTDFKPGSWDGTSLRDKTVGIVGLGVIGKELSRMACCFGAKVIYHSPSPKPEAGWVSFDELIRTADIISIHVPLNSTTINLFNSATIGKMKQGAVLINTSRGAVVDQHALIDALQSGKIGGAVLDVFQHEPEVPDELMKMKNVLLTPHTASGTKSAREASVKTAIQNVVDVLTGNRPLNALNELPE